MIAFIIECFSVGLPPVKKIVKFSWLRGKEAQYMYVMVDQDKQINHVDGPCSLHVVYMFKMNGTLSYNWMPVGHYIDALAKYGGNKQHRRHNAYKFYDSFCPLRGFKTVWEASNFTLAVKLF